MKDMNELPAHQGCDSPGIADSSAWISKIALHVLYNHARYKRADKRSAHTRTLDEEVESTFEAAHQLNHLINTELKLRLRKRAKRDVP